jgi:hypothetical protein
MLARRTPFERAGDTNVWALLHRIAGEQHVPVTKLDAELPAVFDRILDRALAKSPADRYQRAGDMANELRNTRLAGASGTVALAPERSVRAGGSARPPAHDQTSARLIEDLDAFSKVFESKEQERLRAEEEERLRREEALKRWGESEERKRQEFDRTAAQPRRRQDRRAGRARSSS